MGYKVAVVQNENELLRYSYADTRHLLTQERYDWEYFTSENIGTLSSRLEFYDALIVCTNALNNPRIFDWFVLHADLVETFAVEQGRGLLVLFQMALCDERISGQPFPFLPAPFAISGRYRFEQPESASDGTLASNGHFLLDFPATVDVSKLEERCRNNTNAPGLYWGYLSGQHAESYSVVIKDGSKDRALLLASREESGTRIVVSNLVLDWQRHDDLWKNCVRYVVEGRPRTLILRRKGASQIGIDLLCRELWRRKSSYWELYRETLRDAPSGSPFASIVLDSTWDSREVDAYLLASKAERVAGQQNIHYFSQTAADETVTSSISTASSLATTVNRACMWLQSQFDVDSWEGSFWSTYDVLELYQHVGIDLTDFKAPVMAAINRRLQANGSYDDVFGATCAVLQVMTWLQVRDERYRGALAFVNREIRRQNLYNRATAIEIFARIGEPIDDALGARVIEEIEQSVGRWTPGLETIRFMRTLIACDRIETCVSQAHLLRAATTGAEEWLSVYGAADTTLILLDLYAASSASSASTDHLVDTLYGGVSYLTSEIDEEQGSWKQSVVATAKAARTLSSFERLLRASLADLPIRLSWAASQAQENTSARALIVRNTAIAGDLRETKVALDSAVIQIPALQDRKSVV